MSEGRPSLPLESPTTGVIPCLPRELHGVLPRPPGSPVRARPAPSPLRASASSQVVELCRPLDSRLEHVDFECLFKCLSVSHAIRVFASLLLERRVIFVADNLR